MTKRTRRGSIKLTRNMPNMSNNQCVTGGGIALRVTHYKDGHYSLSVDGMPARRINAEYARTLAGSAKELEITEEKHMCEDVRAHISRKNIKLGKTPSFSTSPIIGCSHNCRVCKGTCYALKSYRLYPSVKKAWDENLQLSKTNGGRAEIERAVIAFCKGKRGHVPFFRWFVSGDILSMGFIITMCRIANACRGTTFLAFTKSYHIVNNFCEKYGKNTIPKNLVIVFSEWKPLKLDNPYNFPVAVFVPNGESVPERGIVCPVGLKTGWTCEKCRRCWFMTSGDKVAFLEH